MPKTFQIRVSQEWEDHLDATIREMPTLGGQPPNRAAFVRETIEMENLLWRRSPYVCETSTHYVLVTSSGSFLYLRREDLHLRTDLQWIPAHLGTRPEKRAMEARQWSLNAFALWRGNSAEVASDPAGTTSKYVRFKGPFMEGTRLLREGYFLLSNYAQYREDAGEDLESLYDRADFEIDIPTRSLDILVVVDLRLFAANPDQEPAPSLKFDIRNRDGVVFSSPDAVSHFLRQANLVRIGNRYEPGMEKDRDSLYNSTIELARDRTRDFARSLETVRTHAIEQEPSSEQIDRARSLLELPKRFLFYRISWVGAHIGLTCSIRFPRPYRPGP